MCKNKRVGAMHATTPDFALLAATVLGGAASNIIVNPICNAIWKTDKTKTDQENQDNASKHAAFIKLGLGVVGMMYVEEEYLQAASLGLLVDGASQYLRANVKAFQGIAPGKISTNGVGRNREIIDLNAERWDSINGWETDYAVGHNQGYAVSGGVH